MPDGAAAFSGDLSGVSTLASFNPVDYTPERIADRIADRYRPLTRAEDNERLALGLSYPQYLVYSDQARFRVLVAGRRFGKTFLALHEITRAIQSIPDANIAYVAPTLKMARQLIWKPLKFDCIPKQHIDYTNEVNLELRVKPWGGTIRLYGADHPDNARGQGFDFVIVDEAADVNETMWVEVLRPALADRRGEAVLIGTPKGLSSWLYEVYLRGLGATSEDWSSYTFTTIEGGNVPLAELVEAKASMSSHSFSQEFEASFVNPVGRCFPEFSRSENVSKQAIDLGGEILVGMDFNVNPFSMVFASMDAAGNMLIFDELTLPGANTQIAGDEIRRRYLNREIIVYPDATGRSRRTSAISGTTDFTILGSRPPVGHGFRVIAGRKNPPVRDRMNATNAACRSGDGRRRLLVNPACKQTIRSLEGLTFDEQGRPDKSTSKGLDHLADALGYLIWHALPLLRVKGLRVITTTGH